jgi:hypothetical protein
LPTTSRLPGKNVLTRGLTIALSGEEVPYLRVAVAGKLKPDTPNFGDPFSKPMTLGLTAIAGILAGVVGPFEAACFAAGGALALMFRSSSRYAHPRDALYPARVQLARYRRSEKEAEILVVKLPPGGSISRRGACRRSAKAASSVLRITDGVAMVPSGRRYQICAVLEPDARARAAVERRLRTACGDQVRLGWANAPDDGVALESLIAAAVERIPERQRTPVRRSPARQQPGMGRLVPSILGPDRAPVRKAR